jgi:LysR family transcriptional regulator, regulator for metE and metH
MALQVEIRHLRMVQAISEEQSVTKAGRRLHLTQSALSHQLHDLEERLATPLFWRVNKRMVVTPAGERLLATGREVLRQLEDLEESLRSESGEVHGRLRFSTHCYTCYTWLPAIMRRFNEKYPRVELRIQIEATHRPIDALLEGDIDLAITHMQRNDARLTYLPIFSDELVAVLPRRHALSKRKFLVAEDFAGEPLILHSDPADSWVHKQLFSNGVQPKSVYVVQLTEAILEMVRSGMGVSVLASWSVQEVLRRGELVSVPVTRPGLKRTWHAATIGRTHPPRYVADFIELLRQAPTDSRRRAKKK